MADIHPSTDDNVDPSARDAAKLYAKEFASELLVKAQILAKNRKANREDVGKVWRQIRGEGKRHLWKEAIAGIGWAFLGAFAPIFFDSIQTGKAIPPLQVSICLIGILFIMVGLWER